MTDNQADDASEPNENGKLLATQENFINKFQCPEMFMGRNSMRLTKEGHDLLKGDYEYLKMDLDVERCTLLQEATLNKTLKFPWYMERMRRTDRSPPKNINTYVSVIYLYGDREMAAFLKIVGGNIEMWARAMNDMRIYRTVHPLPEKDWPDPEILHAEVNKPAETKTKEEQKENKTSTKGKKGEQKDNEDGNKPDTK